jgi:hypothetical protein
LIAPGEWKANMGTIFGGLSIALGLTALLSAILYISVPLERLSQGVYTKAALVGPRLDAPVDRRARELDSESLTRAA